MSITQLKLGNFNLNYWNINLQLDKIFTELILLKYLQDLSFIIIL